MFDVNNAPKSRLLFLLGISEVHQPKFLSKLLASLLGVESHSKEEKIDVNGFESCVTKWPLSQLKLLPFYLTFNCYHWSWARLCLQSFVQKSLFTVLQLPQLHTTSSTQQKIRKVFMHSQCQACHDGILHWSEIIFEVALFFLSSYLFTRYFFHFLTKGVSKDSKVACQNLLILLSIDNSIANISLYELSKPLNFFKVRFWGNTRQVLAGYSVPAIFVYVQLLHKKILGISF